MARPSTRPRSRSRVSLTLTLTHLLFLTALVAALFFLSSMPLPARAGIVRTSSDFHSFDVMQRMLSEYTIYSNGSTTFSINLDLSVANQLQFFNQTADFVLTSLSLNASDIATHPNATMMPLLALAVAPLYRLDELTPNDPPVVFSRDIIALIYLGNLTRWNDPRLVTLNPTITLPAADIIVVVDQGFTATNNALTAWLSKSATNFSAQIGSTPSPSWPYTRYAQWRSARGRRGIPALIARTPYALAVSWYPDSIELHMQVGSLVNVAGRTVRPTATAVTLSLLERASNNVANRLVVADASDSTNLESWPIVLISYVLFDRYTTLLPCADRLNMVQGLIWMYERAATTITSLGYVPIPDDILTQLNVLDDLLYRVSCNGTPLNVSSFSEYIRVGASIDYSIQTSLLTGNYQPAPKRISATQVLTSPPLKRVIADADSLASMLLNGTLEIAILDLDTQSGARLATFQSDAYLAVPYSYILHALAYNPMIASSVSVPPTQRPLLTMRLAARLLTLNVSTWSDPEMLDANPWLVPALNGTSPPITYVYGCRDPSSRSHILQVLQDYANDVDPSLKPLLQNDPSSALGRNTCASTQPSLVQWVEIEQSVYTLLGDVPGTIGASTVDSIFHPMNNFDIKWRHGVPTTTSTTTSAATSVRASSKSSSSSRSAPWSAVSPTTPLLVNATRYPSVDAASIITDDAPRSSAIVSTTATAAVSMADFIVSPSSRGILACMIDSLQRRSNASSVLTFRPSTTVEPACYPFVSLLHWIVRRSYPAAEWSTAYFDAAFLQWLVIDPTLSVTLTGLPTAVNADSRVKALLVGELNTITAGGQSVLVTPSADWSPAVSAQVLAMALAALGICTGVAALASLYVYRSHAVMRSATPLFVALSLVGTMVMFASVLVGTYTTTTVSCRTLVLLAHMSISLTLAPLFVKTWRIHRIFGRRRLRVVRITNSRLLMHVMIIVFIDIIILLVWAQYGLLVASTNAVTTGLPPQTTVYTTCTTNSSTGSTMVTVMIIYRALFLAAGALFAFRVRNVSSAFNESSQIAMIVYNCVVVVAMVVTALTVSSNRNQLMDMVTWYSLLEIAFVTQAFIIIPKLNVIQHMKAMAKGGGAGGGGRGAGAGGLNASAKDESMAALGTLADEISFVPEEKLVDLLTTEAYLHALEKHMASLRQRIQQLRSSTLLGGGKAGGAGLAGEKRVVNNGASSANVPAHANSSSRSAFGLSATAGASTVKLSVDGSSARPTTAGSAPRGSTLTSVDPMRGLSVSVAPSSQHPLTSAGGPRPSATAMRPQQLQ